jgi:CRISPR-associated protein Cmr6
MSPEDAEETVGELFGAIEPNTYKGCVRLQVTQSSTWGERSDNQPSFYLWKGKLQINAPKEILNKIILPIIKFAAMVGGVGRGWRRPLHIFHMNNGRAAARGTHLTLTHKIKNPNTQEWETKPYGLPLDTSLWNKTYQDWLTAVRTRWSDRVTENNNHNIGAEVFSPSTCGVYAVPGPNIEPIDYQELCWKQTNNAQDTRGDGMYLIYQQQSPHNYKRNPDIGGNAAGGGNSHCSWASIKRVKIPNHQQGTKCQEIVCLFMGGERPNSNHIRARFLQDLKNIAGVTHLFGV